MGDASGEEVRRSIRVGDRDSGREEVSKYMRGWTGDAEIHVWRQMGGRGRQWWIGHKREDVRMGMQREYRIGCMIMGENP